MIENHDSPSPARVDDESASPPAGSDAQASVIRSEETLRVHTERVPMQRVRLQKVVVTEERTITVTLRHEEFRLVHEPVDAASTSPDTFEGSAGIDLVLHEERPVVTTEVVPIERVHVRVVTTDDEVPVSASVRRERVEVSTAPLPPAPPITDQHDERIPHE